MALRGIAEREAWLARKAAEKAERATRARGCIVQVRVTPAEREALRARAEPRALSVYLRERVLSAPAQDGASALPSPAPRFEVDVKLMTELRRIGVNLNQIARRLNSDEPLPEGALPASLKALDHALSRLERVYLGLVEASS